MSTSHHHPHPKQGLSRAGLSATEPARTETAQRPTSSDTLDTSPARAFAGFHAIHRLRRGLAAALLGLPLLLAVAAPNAAYAQTTCNVSDATEQATDAFDYHRDDSGGNAPTATAAYRVLIALGGTLPAWTGSNISGNAPTTPITEAELRTFLNGRNDAWDGWNPVYTALNCLEAAPPPPPPPPPSSNLLVGNLDQSDDGTATFQRDHAQQFTTGGNAGGYRLTSVDVEFASLERTTAFDRKALTINIRAHSGNRPGEVVSGLIRPEVSRFSSDQVITFTAPGRGIDLDAGTSYWLMFDVMAYHGANVAKIRTTSAHATDAGGAAGFAIADQHRWRSAPANTGIETGNDGWETATGRALKFRINGRALPAPSTSNTPPGLVFDTTQLTWDESDGCADLEYYHSSGGRITGSNPRQRALDIQWSNVQLPSSAPGPSYKVKLKTQPRGRVEVTVYDPNDLVWWGNGHRTLNRVFVGPLRGPGHGDLLGPTLTFTLDNWNEWQTVKAKVACTDHFQDAVPLEHRMVSKFVAAQAGGGVDYSYPEGADDQTWNVWVGVNEATPPMEVLDLPAAGQPITLARGATKDFRIRIGDRMLPDGASGGATVYLYSEPAGAAALSVAGRDGVSVSEATIQHVMGFDPSTREQWARLEGVRAGIQTELVISAERDFTWAHETRRHWTLTWPVTITEPGQGAPAQAAPAPTETVANVRATAADDASASVSWDAVEHATAYEVSWDGSGSETAVTGILPGVTGTTTTIRHDAEEAMTLTVTVTPEYVGGNGQVVQLPSLAGTATLDVGPRPLNGGGTSGGGDGGPVSAGEGESPGTGSLALPVAHWRLDGDALDWAGSSHGTVGGGAAFAANDEGEGVGSHALVLDGVDDHVDLASHVSNFPLGDAARTVAGWFKADAGNQRQTFLTYGPDAAGQRFSIAADRTQVLVAVSGHARGVNGLDLAEGWHHVAVTYAGGNSDGISIYLDGALQPASTLVGAPQSVDTRAGPAAIGRSAGGAAHYAGSIDDVRIYDAALGAEQVFALFNEHPQTPPPTTTAVTATASPALAEGNLDGAAVELTLDAGAFAATVATSDVTASGVSGVGVSSVTRDSDTRATATLAFDGTDFDADATLTLTVSADALAHSDADLSATLPVTAVDEPPPPPPPPPAVSIPAPVAHWRFDGDADDSAGSSNGAARNGASFTSAASVGTHALSLDGSDDHVDLASHASSFPLGNAARSVTGWFRADAGNQRQTFLTYGPNVEGKRLSIAADRTQAVVAVSGHAWGVNNLSLADGWHHVAVTFAGGRSDEFSIYLNGVKQSASTLGGVRRQVDTRTGTAAIGRSVGGNAHYGGDIDDVRLYGHALSAEQVRAIAQGEDAQGTAAPGGPTPRALPRPNGGPAGAFGAGGVGPNSTTALANTPESDGPRNGSIAPSDSRAPGPNGRAHASLLPSASDPMREGLVRIVNPSAQAGEVRIVAIDDAGWRGAPVTLAIGAGESAQFTSRDLERGNAAMGLSGATGPGTGDWRLEVASDLDVEVLPYARAADGALSAMGDVAPATDNVHRVALFNPADSSDAASRLRLTNRGAQALRANITGIDDAGTSPGGMVSVEIAAHASVSLTAAELESGGSNLLGALGDGEGAWRLDIASNGDLAVMNLVETPDGRLANLSGAAPTAVPARRVHVVADFPSSADQSGARGVLRIVNGSGNPASIRIEPHDGTGWRYAPLTLTLGAGEAANLGTWDLELGNASKNLAGSAGPGAGGVWRLEISGDGDIEVLAYSRAPNGLPRPLPGDAAAQDKMR